MSRTVYVLNLNLKCTDVSTFMGTKGHLLKSLSELNPSIVSFSLEYEEVVEES